MLTRKKLFDHCVKCLRLRMVTKNNILCDMGAAAVTTEALKLLNDFEKANGLNKTTVDEVIRFAREIKND